jgi:ribonuclease-3
MSKDERADDPTFDAMRRRRLAELAERIGHEFEDLALLHRALVHASTGNEGRESYERLEFLGDSVLGFLVADHLYRSGPDGANEGDLTELRSRVVSRRPLSRLSRELGLISHLLTGRGMQNRDLESPRIHADLVEAVLGAIYVDGGIRAAKKFVRRHLLRPAAAEAARNADRDAKSRLQHFAQSRGLGHPGYDVIDEEGPDHERRFTVVCTIAGERHARGTGHSKRTAQMQAAEATLAALLAAEKDAGPERAAES